MPVSTANGHKAPIVLLVEDEFFVRCGVAERLRESGYTVVETASGEEAIALCRSDLAIDIVFTDINLTGAASGWDVSECLLADRPNVPVLYTSGQVIERERCVPGGVFIAKPYLMRISSTPVSNSEPNDHWGVVSAISEAAGTLRYAGECMPTSEQYKRRVEECRALAEQAHDEHERASITCSPNIRRRKRPRTEAAYRVSRS